MSYNPELMGPVNVPALSSEDYDRYSVDMWAAISCDSYIRNTLERAAVLCEKRAMEFEVGYHRHWNNVDARVLRNLAAMI